jgi:hypothetical protein
MTEVHDVEFGVSAFGAGAIVLYTDHTATKRVIYQVTEPSDDSDSDDDSSPFMADFKVDDGLFAPILEVA